ncbi:flagellar brake protein [Propionivibrio sp.]|uniref:flagellar brake protein n=1 Tax=Propionivibrio sp. TaxID=2212460 RepID=UPI0026148D50|nr:flagellar brake protein [Propionivibrio sp.]
MAETEVQADSEPSPAAFELERPNDYSKFLLYSKSEILAVLRALIQKGSMVTVHFDRGNSFLLTSIIALSTDNREFFLDMGSDDEMNRRALLTNKLIFTTIIDKVKVQFSLNKVSQTQHDGRLAFLASVPETLLRLQRREYFRLPTPVVNPLKLNTIVKCPDDSTLRLDLSLMDISGGGVGLIVPPDQAGLFQRGDILDECKIMLPDEGLLIVSLCVRNQFDVTTRSGSRFFRVGCEFLNLSASRLTLVQRYITRIERERKARLNGLA